jgi:hypothetical protein
MAENGGTAGIDNPCLSALRLDLSFPAADFGPVLSLALARLAAICRSEAINQMLFCLMVQSRSIEPDQQVARLQKRNNLAAERTGFPSQVERH